MERLREGRGEGMRGKGGKGKGVRGKGEKGRKARGRCACHLSAVALTPFLKRMAW